MKIEESCTLYTRNAWTWAQLSKKREITPRLFSLDVQKFLPMWFPVHVCVPTWPKLTWVCAEGRHPAISLPLHTVKSAYKHLAQNILLMVIRKLDSVHKIHVLTVARDLNIQLCTQRAHTCTYRNLHYTKGSCHRLLLYVGRMMFGMLIYLTANWYSL